MKKYVALTFALLACAIGRAENTTASPPGVLLDRVWSGHPVRFAFVAHEGHLFAAYYDAERKITVAARAPGQEKWTKFHPDGVWIEGQKRQSNVTGWDSHNALALAVDRDGIVHLSGNMHVDPLIYYRSKRPCDITTLERLDRMTGERETRCTYPVFFKNGAGELFFRYRDGGSGRGSDIYNAYDPATRTWRHLLATPLHDGEGKRNAYALDPILGPDGRFHMLWMWRHTPDAATNHALSYVRSRDLRHWEDGRGREVTLPITFGEGDLVDPAEAGQGLINTTYALGFDREHRPVALYHRYDASGHSQIFAARPTDDGWKQQALTDWKFRWAFGGGGSIAVDVYLHPPRTEPDGTMLAPFRAKEAKSGVLRFDPEKLATIDVLPPDPLPLPENLMQPVSNYPGMLVHTKIAREGNKSYVLRWETLPTNRDRSRDEVPPPSGLRVFERDAIAFETPPADR